jgi:hypothetical protein
MGSPARQARPSLAQKSRAWAAFFGPTGGPCAAKMRPDCWLGPGLGSIFGSFWEGPVRKPDGPTKNTLRLGLGRIFRPDSWAGSGLGRHFLCRAFGPARPEKMPRYTHQPAYIPDMEYDSNFLYAASSSYSFSVKPIFHCQFLQVKLQCTNCRFIIKPM